MSLSDVRSVAYARMLREQGVTAEGCALVTCGASTGHFVRPLAFCASELDAAVLAEMLKADSPSHSPTLGGDDD